MSKPSSPSAEPLTQASGAAILPPLLTVEDLAAWLGISPRGARLLLDRGELPSFRLGRRRYCRVEEVEAALRAKETDGAARRLSAVAGLRVLAGLPARPSACGKRTSRRSHRTE